MKAILVLEMPSSCDMCDFVQIDNMVGNMTCMNPTSEVYGCDVSDYIGCRANGCPLREAPQKKDVSMYKGLMGASTLQVLSYKQGYNACIDEIFRR